MASILKVDDLRGNTSAGDITITSEGGAATQSLQQGVAKQWANLVGTGTATIVDSLNTSSITDNGTGNYDFDLTNAFSTDDYSINVTGNYAGNFCCVYNNTTFDTDGWNVRAFGYNGASLSDTNNCMTNCFGDLA